MSGVAALVRGTAGRSVVVAAAVGIALFGSFLLLVTPDFGGHPGLQTVWVVVALVLLKLPLLGLVWWLIARRRRGPETRWSLPETERLLAGIEDGVAAAAGGPDAAARLDVLRADAWKAAREGDPAATPRAVEIALRIDRMCLREGPATARGRNSAK